MTRTISSWLDRSVLHRSAFLQSSVLFDVRSPPYDVLALHSACDTFPILLKMHFSVVCSWKIFWTWFRKTKNSKIQAKTARPIPVIFRLFRFFLWLLFSLTLITFRGTITRNHSMSIEARCNFVPITTMTRSSFSSKSTLNHGPVRIVVRVLNPFLWLKWWLVNLKFIFHSQYDLHWNVFSSSCDRARLLPLPRPNLASPFWRLAVFQVVSSEFPAPFSSSHCISMDLLY